MPHHALKKSFEESYVMFGVDHELGNHVGFANIVRPVQRDLLYVGVGEKDTGCDISLVSWNFLLIANGTHWIQSLSCLYSIAYL